MRSQEVRDVWSDDNKERQASGEELMNEKFLLFFIRYKMNLGRNTRHLHEHWFSIVLKQKEAVPSGLLLPSLVMMTEEHHHQLLVI